MDTFCVGRNRIPTILALLLCCRIISAVSAQVQIQVQPQPLPPQNEEVDLTDAIRSEIEAVTDEEFRLPLDATAAQSADTLIPKLGSPSYKEREEASAGLIEIGAPAFGKLRDAYRANPKLEVLLRIEHIVRTAYLNHHVYDRSGFLGINLQTYSASAEEHPRLPPGAVGVKVGRIIPNTAAERAGMQVDDVIFEVDGVPLKGEGMQVVENFSAMIRARGPGGKMNLTIMRGTQQIPTPVTVGRCPEEIAKQGSVRTVSENHFKATAKFPKWWSKYFVGQSAQGPAKITFEPPTRVEPLK